MDSKKVKMKKIYYIVCGKYEKSKKPKTYIFYKTLALSIICSKCINKD